MNKHCESHMEYGRHLSDSLCPYAENETAPMQPLEALDRIIGAAQEEAASLADMAHHADEDSSYQASVESLEKALASEGDLRRIVAAAPELLEALQRILGSTDCNLDEQSDETSKAMKQAYAVLAKAKGGSTPPPAKDDDRTPPPWKAKGHLRDCKAVAYDHPCDCVERAVAAHQELVALLKRFEMLAGPGGMEFVPQSFRDDVKRAIAKAEGK